MDANAVLQLRRMKALEDEIERLEFALLEARGEAAYFRSQHGALSSELLQENAVLLRRQEVTERQIELLMLVCREHVPRDDMAEVQALLDLTAKGDEFLDDPLVSAQMDEVLREHGFTKEDGGESSQDDEEEDGLEEALGENGARVLRNVPAPRRRRGEDESGSEDGSEDGSSEGSSEEEDSEGNSEGDSGEEEEEEEEVAVVGEEQQQQQQQQRRRQQRGGRSPRQTARKAMI